MKCNVKYASNFSDYKYSRIRGDQGMYSSSRFLQYILYVTYIKGAPAFCTPTVRFINYVIDCRCKKGSHSNEEKIPLNFRSSCGPISIDPSTTQELSHSNKVN